MKTLLAFILFSAVATPLSAQVTHQVDVGPGGTITFSPQHLVVNVGDKVHWVWATGLHNVNSQDGYFLSGPPASPPNDFILVFDQAFLNSAPISSNRYEYQCDVHVGFGMTGSVTVLTPGVPVLTITDPSPGAATTITVDGVTPNGNVIVAYSTNGGGPMGSPFGTALLTPPIKQLPAVTAGSAGSVRFTLNVPTSTPPGLTIWNQALDVSAGVLSNGARVIV